MSRSARFVANYSSNIIYTAITIAVGFVATPLLIRWLGDERFGAFRALVDWFGYVALVELGLGGATQTLLARVLAGRDELAVGRVMRAAIRAYFRVAILMLLAGIILYLVVTKLIHIAPEYEHDLRQAAAINVFILLTAPLSPFRSLAEAEQREFIVNGLLVAQYPLTISVSLGLAWAGWGIKGQVIALAVGVIPMFVALAWSGLRRHPTITTVRGADTQAEWMDLWQMNMPMFLFQVTARVSLLTDNITVAAVVGAAAVTPFVVTQRLTSLIQSQLQGLGTASWAGLAELYAEGARAVLNERILELTRWVAIISSAILGTTIAYNQQFIEAWLGKGHYAGNAITILASVNAFMQAQLFLWSLCFSGTGRIKVLLRVRVVWAALNIGLSVLLAAMVGLAGPLWGTLLSTLLVLSWSVPMYLNSHFGIKPKDLAWAALAPLLVSLPYGIGLAIMAQRYPPHGILRVGLEMIAGATGFFVVIMYALFTRIQRRELWLRAKRIAARS